MTKTAASPPVAIVTGAGSGLGEACAVELADRGYALVLMTRSDGAERLAARIGGIGLRGSVTDTDDLQRLVDTALDRHGRIDAVLNNTGHPPNTGIAGTGPRFDAGADLRLLEASDDAWRETLDMVLLNVVRMTRLVADRMAAQGGGSIVNMSSFAQKEPSFAYPLGSCMRMALAGFTKLFADSYGGRNVRMNNILPGFIDNFPFSDDLRGQIPMGRPGTVAEVAKTIAFLMSADAGYITGQSILVDGGLNRGT